MTDDEAAAARGTVAWLESLVGEFPEEFPKSEPDYQAGSKGPDGPTTNIRGDAMSETVQQDVAAKDFYFNPPGTGDKVELPRPADGFYETAPSTIGPDEVSHKDLPAFLTSKIHRAIEEGTLYKTLRHYAGALSAGTVDEATTRSLTGLAGEARAARHDEAQTKVVGKKALEYVGQLKLIRR